MWSVVESTALAEAEIEYEDYESDTIWVKFPVAQPSVDGRTPPRSCRSRAPDGASVVIWTTTPWTIPGNRAISFSSQDRLRPLSRSPRRRRATGPRSARPMSSPTSWPPRSSPEAKVEAFERLQRRAAADARRPDLRPPAARLGGGYEFDVPLLDGEHVTDDAGTGFVHTAPGHGLDDFDIWMAIGPPARRSAASIPPSPTRSMTTASTPRTRPGFEGARVIDDNGKKGDANNASSRRWPSAATSSRAAA